MSNYKHQKKHHGIPGLESFFAKVFGGKNKGNKHKKKVQL